MALVLVGGALFVVAIILARPAPPGLVSPDGELRAIVHFEHCPDFVEQIVPVFEEGQLVCPVSELLLLDADGNYLRTLLKGNWADINTLGDDWDLKYVGQIYRLQWSPDGERLYYLTDTWTTSSATRFVELNSGADQFFATGVGHVIRVCETMGRDRDSYRGYLLVYQTAIDPTLQRGRLQWASIVTPDGEVVNKSEEDRLKSGMPIVWKGGPDPADDCQMMPETGAAERTERQRPLRRRRAGEVKGVMRLAG